MNKSTKKISETGGEKEAFCGAKTRDGKTCKNVAGKGTDHVGSGKCKFHGGKSTGAKTLKGKSKSSQNSRTHGLYSTVLSEPDKQRLEQAQEFSHGEILAETFYVTHSRLANILAGGGELRGQAKVVMQACEVLVDAGELTAEYAEEVRLRLLNLDVGQINQLFVSTIPLADAAVRFDDVGQARSQLAILQKTIVEVLRTTSEKAVKELILGAIQQLKLEAGLPVEAIEEYLAEAQKVEDAKKKEEEGEEEPEPEEDIEDDEDLDEERSLETNEVVDNSDVLEGDIWD